MTKTRPVIERFWPKVDQTDTCWLWTGCIHKKTGYGRFGYGPRCATGLVHRFAYEQFVGPIPDGMDIDHTCRVRNCVNPAHLRPATRKQNMENLGGAHRDSKSGVRGVRLFRGRYQAVVGHNYQRIHLGTFDTIEEANAVVMAKRAELFTHEVRV